MQTLNLKSYIKNIKKALKQDHLFNDDELRKMKNDLRNLQKTQQMMRDYQNNGFGQYLRQPVEFASTAPSSVEEEVVELIEPEIVEDIPNE